MMGNLKLPSLVRILLAFVFFLLLTLSVSVMPRTTAQEAPTPISPARLPDALLNVDLPAVSGALSVKPLIATLSSDLAQLVEVWRVDPLAAQSQAQAADLDLVGDRVAVMFVFVNSIAADSALPVIQAAGADIIARYDRWIDARVPVLSLDVLAQLPGISLVRRVIPVTPVDGANDQPAAHTAAQAIGTYLTEGVAASNANTWHTLGYTGNGIRVAILDTFQDFATAQSAGEVPPSSRVTTYIDIDADSRHGTAVAEIIYDMAPGVAQILSSPVTVTDMASRIIGLAELPSGSRPHIISSSMGFFNFEPGDGSGGVSQAINYAQSKGIFYAQAAGNQALANWQASFVDTDADNWHNFSSNAEINFLNDANPLPAGYPISVSLRWNDWPASDQDYDLYLYSCVAPNPCELVASSINVQNGTQPPTEDVFLFAPINAYYGYAIDRFSGTGNAVLDVMGANLPPTVFGSADRSLIDAATGTGTFGVAALNRLSPFTLENYSSEGPAMGAGGTLGTGSAQPRLSGFANVDTWSYGLDTFNGTSAAAPHIAGAAALIWSAYPGYSVFDVRTFLESRAVDMGSASYDSVYGAGRLWLGSAPIPPSNTPTNTFTPSNTPTFTPTPTNTFTPSNTPTFTATFTPSNTPTPTNTFTPSNTPTHTPTHTPSNTPTFTPTNTPSNTPSNTPTLTPSNTPTATATKVPEGIPIAPMGTITTNQPIFSWTASSPTAWYYLWLSGSGGTVLNQWYDGGLVCTGGTCSVNPDQFLPNGDYQWWLQTWTPAQGYMPWSSAVSFTVNGTPIIPTPVSPTGTITNTQPTMVWNGVQTWGWYYLWLEGPSGKVLDQWYDGWNICVNNVCSVPLSVTLAGGTYTWWVQAWTPSGGYTAWSSPAQFVVAQPPPAPITLSPLGTIASANPTFTWNAVPAGAWYYLWVSGIDGKVLDQWYPATGSCAGGVCMVTPTLNLSDGLYTWWVQAWSVEGGYGAWSVATPFVVNAVPSPADAPPTDVPPEATLEAALPTESPG